MNKNLKKFGALLGAAAIVLTMAFPSSVLAGAATKPREQKGAQSAFENPSMIGCNICSVDASTTGKQCATGSGLLYWLSVSGDGSVAGKGVRAFDCANGTHLSGLTASGAIGPKVYACATATYSQGNLSPWEPGKSAPARFETGLAMKTDDAGVYAQACWRYDSGVNP